MSNTGVLHNRYTCVQQTEPHTLRTEVFMKSNDVCDPAVIASSVVSGEGSLSTDLSLCLIHGPDSG